MSSSDEEACMIVRAFKIDGSFEEDDPNLPPTSGNEYLRRVQKEYRQCPKVVVADMDTNQFLANRTVKVDLELRSCVPAPAGFSPTIQWQKEQIAFFSDTRRRFHLYKEQSEKTKPPFKLPRFDDDAGWCRLCFGNNSNSDNTKEVAGVSPLASLIRSMSQPLLEQLLTYHVSWLEVTGFTQHQGRWFYALLTALEKPLTPEACSLLRSLARSCARLRVRLANVEDPFLVPLNLLITLVSRYFDQKDLAD